LTTVLNAAEEMKAANLQVPTKTRVILYRPTVNPTNGYFNGFDPVGMPITE